MFAQDNNDEKQKLPPEKIWAEFMELKPNTRDLIENFRAKQPFLDWTVVELWNRTLSNQDIVLILRELNNHRSSDAFWQRLIPTAAKSDLLTVLANCSWRSNCFRKISWEILKHPLSFSDLDMIAQARPKKSEATKEGEIEVFYVFKEEENTRDIMETVWSRYVTLEPDNQQLLDVISKFSSHESDHLYPLSMRRKAAEELSRRTLTAQQLLVLVEYAPDNEQRENATQILLACNLTEQELEGLRYRGLPATYKGVVEQMLQARNYDKKIALQNLMR